MRQKVLISAALLHDPECWCSTSRRPPGRRLGGDVPHLIKAARASRQTVLYSSHELRDRRNGRRSSRRAAQGRWPPTIRGTLRELMKLVPRRDLHELVFTEDPEAVAHRIVDTSCRGTERWTGIVGRSTCSSATSSAASDNDVIAPAAICTAPVESRRDAGARRLLYPFKLLVTYGRPFWDYGVLDESRGTTRARSC